MKSAIHWQFSVEELKSEAGNPRKFSSQKNSIQLCPDMELVDSTQKIPDTEGIVDLSALT